MEVFSADDSDLTKFENWMARFKFSLDCTAPNMVDAAKVKLLMTKLSAEAFAEYRKSCLPKEVTEFNLDETVGGLSKFFAHSRSLVVDRFECLRLVKEDGEEFRHFVNRLKGQLCFFKFSSLKQEEFNCLLLLGLMTNQDAVLRTRILQRLNSDGDAVKFDEVVEETAAYLSTIAEAKHLERKPEPFAVNAIAVKREPPQQYAAAQNRAPPPSACYRCDQLHWSEDCPHINHRCSNCHKPGHLEHQCFRYQNFKPNATKKRFLNTDVTAAAVTSPGCLLNSASAFAAKMSPGHPVNSASAAVTSPGCPLNSSSAANMSPGFPLNNAAALSIADAAVPAKHLLSKPCYAYRVDLLPLCLTVPVLLWMLVVVPPC